MWSLSKMGEREMDYEGRNEKYGQEGRWKKIHNYENVTLFIRNNNSGKYLFTFSSYIISNYM